MDCWANVQWALLALFGYVFYHFVEKRRNKRALEVLIEQRKRQRVLNFSWAKKVSSQLDEVRAEEIVALPFEKLAEKLKSREILSSEALRAYQRKALECTEQTNCVCLFVEDALRQAEELDERAKSPDFIPPPFFGIPISVKESVCIKHMDCTIGFAQNLNETAKNDANVVKQLIWLGAVPFVHTNIPQALLSFGCTNPIYGTTSNPHDVSRVPGGSSGGEAALIAGGGSPLGIGTDVGGSIRTPASFCGIAGFKPCSERMSHNGKVGSIPGRTMLVTTEGPMAPNISACINYMRTIWSDEKFFASDPFVPPVPWQEHLYSSEKTLNIGFYTFDGYSEPPPAYQRAVLDTVALLRSQGHNLVEFQVPRPAEAFELFVASSTGDGGTFLKQKLDLDIVPPECYIGSPITRLPVFLQKIIIQYIPWPRIKAVLEAMPKNCVELRETFAKIEEYRHDFVRAMRRQNLDAIVCPAFGSIAPHVGKANDMISATCYTSLYNLIDFPAGVVQVTRVSKKDESEVREMPDVDKWAKMTRDECNNSVGLPISVQIAAPPFREELCLRLLRDVEKTS